MNRTISKKGRDINYVAICLTAFIFSFVAMAAVACAAPRQARGADPQYSGKFVVPKGLFAGGNARKMQNTAAFSLPYIDGVSASVAWKSIEIEEGRYDWSELDNLLALARKNGKILNIRVYAGANSPSWLLEKYPVQRFSYTWKPTKYQKIQDLDDTKYVTPLTWDKVYLEKWRSFLKALAARYGNDDSVGYISLSGGGFRDFTMSIPIRDSEAIARLKAAGYSPETMIRTWEGIADYYASVFPKKKWALSVGPVIVGEKDFRVAYEVTDYVLRKYQNNVIVMGVDLNDAWFNKGENRMKVRLLKDCSDFVYTGYMLAQSADRGRRSGKKHPLITSIRKAFENGYSVGISFLEVWHNTDVMLPGPNKPNPRYVDDLVHVHDVLAKKGPVVHRPYDGSIGKAAR